ncbi:hypothetical protein BH11PSE2_BH11PSE2_03190 [soil metagenome]
MKLFTGLAIAVALIAAPSAASAAQICAWLTETTKADDLHDFSLWLQSDAELEIYYKMAGEGLVTESSKLYSPGSGTFVLHAGKAAKPWGFGATLNPPGDIDIIAEIHKKPVDIFSDAPSPLLASFAFKRHVPESEKKAPATFSTKQCKTATE